LFVLSHKQQKIFNFIFKFIFGINIIEHLLGDDQAEHFIFNEDFAHYGIKCSFVLNIAILEVQLDVSSNGRENFRIYCRVRVFVDFL